MRRGKTAPWCLAISGPRRRPVKGARQHPGHPTSDAAWSAVFNLAPACHFHHYLKTHHGSVLGGRLAAWTWEPAAEVPPWGEKGSAPRRLAFSGPRQRQVKGARQHPGHPTSDAAWSAVFKLAPACHFHHYLKTHHGSVLAGRPGVWTWEPPAEVPP